LHNNAFVGWSPTGSAPPDLLVVISVIRGRGGMKWEGKGREWGVEEGKDVKG